MDVIKISKMQYAWLSLVGYCATFLGTLYFNIYLRDMEYRRLLRYACFFGIFASTTVLAFVLHWNRLLGISDMSFIFLTDAALETVWFALTQLPIMVLFAKVTPDHIEGACFAFVMGTYNFATGVISATVGNLINSFTFKVTNQSLDNFWKL